MAVLFTIITIPCFSQLVGIGTTTPQVPLHVKTTTFGEALRLEGINPFLSFWDNTTGYRGSIISRSTQLELYNGLPIVIAPGFTPSATFLANGNVGIGTAAPQVRLEVMNPVNSAIKIRSNNYLDTARLMLSNRNPSEQGTDFIFSANRETGLNILTTSDLPANNNASILFLSPQGNVGIGTTTPLQTVDVNGRMNITNGVIQRGGAAITATSDLGLYSRVAGNYIRFVTNAAPIRFFSDDNIGTTANMTIEANGNVGIGNSSPADKLDVNGNINVTGLLKINSNSGTAGQVLVSNGAAAPTWQNPVVSSSYWTAVGTDIYNSNTSNVGIGTTTPQAKLEVNGFTKLGSDAPKIKIKKLTGTTSPDDGGVVYITHGINSAKILAVEVLVEYLGGAYIHQGYRYQAGYEYNVVVGVTLIHIYNMAFNSGSILSKPLRILITYEE